MFIDTSGFLCLLHRSEPFHQEAIDKYFAAPRKLTHGYVLAEFVAVAQVRGLQRERVLLFISDLLENPDIRTVWSGGALIAEGLSLLNKRKDKSYSLCDAVSFVLMQQFDIPDALTTDHHFEQEGYIRLLGDR
ncbi:MAG: PIN domain-containing protein [Planctomycetota bacterium]|nr:PIN domain-containing protein [Planctomycetota bacterium]MDA1141436.1 PIN domain-containing protein [Planctomycetota bacterium]